MNKIENKRFFMEKSLDKNSIVNIQNQELINCIFDNCSIGTEDNLSKISYFKNIKMTDCTILNCMVGPTIFEDVLIKNLKTGDIAIFDLPLLRHVKIEGKVGNLKINNIGFTLEKSLSKKKELLDLKNKFYETVDWALDISCAKFIDFYCLGIPTHLIKINNENQIKKIGYQYYFFMNNNRLTALFFCYPQEDTVYQNVLIEKIMSSLNIK